MRRLCLFAAALLALLAACQQPGFDAPASGTLTVIPSFAGARTVAADFPGLTTSYQVDLTSQSGFPSQTQTVTSGPATFPNVGLGSWTVTVTAYNGVQVLGVGTAGQSVSAGTTINVTVKATQTGTGGYAFAFTLPVLAGVDAVSAHLLRWDDSSAGPVQSPPLSSDGTTQSAVVSEAGVPSGAYRLELTFLRGAATAAVWSEAVNIWDGVVSNRWLSPGGTLLSGRAFTAGDFNTAEAGLSALTVTGFTTAALSPAFSSGTQDYAALVGTTLAPVKAKVKATGVQPGQTLELRQDGGAWSSLISGTASAALTLTGASTVEVRVTATDHVTQKTYTLHLAPGSVTYHGNGSDGGTVPSGSWLDSGASLTVAGGYSPPTRTGYHLNGWNTAADGLGTAYAVGSTLVMGQTAVDLWAQWIPNTYRVFLFPNGAPGSLPDLSVDYGQTVNLTAITLPYPDYVFQGWAATSGGPVVYLDQGAYQQTTAGDVNLYAVWTPRQYHIRFHANGGSGSMADQTGTHYSTLNLTTSTFTFDQQHFAGWATASGTAVNYPDHALFFIPGNDVDLYARWIPDRFVTTTQAVTGNTARVVLTGVAGGTTGAVVVPDVVTEVYVRAFQNQAGVTSVTLPDTVTSIGSWAFNGCPALTAIWLGAGVTSLGQEVFSGCTSLATVTVPLATPPSLYDTGSYPSFAGCPPGFQILVPAGSLTAYQAAPGWSNWSTHIFGY